MEIPKVKTGKLLGHLKDYVGNPLFYLKKQHAEYGDIFKFRLAYRYLHVTKNPDHIQHILRDNHRNYRKSLAYRKLKLLLGNGLFTNEGESWLKQRRLAQPSFHQKKISNYEQEMLDITQQHLKCWQDKKQVDLLSEMTTLTLKIISKTLLGVSLDKEGRSVEQHLPFALSFMMKRVTSSINSPMWWPSQKNKQYKKGVMNMNNLIERLIEKKRRETNGEDLLSMLIKARDETTGEGMTNKQLRDEVLTFFLAGHETTAITMVWAVFYIETNEKVKQKLLSQLEKGNYLENVVKETMRMVSPIWVLGRESLDEDRLGDYTLGKKESIIFSPYLVHHDERYWDSPEEFLPERFESPLLHEYCYFPFGAGPRVCIGNHFAMMEAKVILREIYKQHKIQLDNTEHPGFDFSLTLRPQQNLWVNLM